MYYKYNKEPPKKRTGNYLGPYIQPSTQSPNKRVCVDVLLLGRHEVERDLDPLLIAVSGFSAWVGRVGGWGYSGVLLQQGFIWRVRGREGWEF